MKPTVYYVYAISTFSTSLLAKSVAFPLAHVATHANDKPFPRIVPGLSFLNQYPCHAFKRCPSTIKHPGKNPLPQSNVLGKILEGNQCFLNH